jgi:hypothetical protein
MQASPQPTTPQQPTVPNVEMARVAMQIPRQVWNRMKIQAIHEGTTAEQLCSRIFLAYLDSPGAEAARKQ